MIWLFVPAAILWVIAGVFIVFGLRENSTFYSGSVSEIEAAFLVLATVIAWPVGLLGYGVFALGKWAQKE